jgi:GntR family transcriptional regulator
VTWPPNEPWAAVPSRVIEALMQLSCAATRVYLALAKRANRDGRCWPAVGTLMKECNLCRRAVQEATRELRTAALVSIDRAHSEEGAIKSNVYQLLSMPPEKKGAAECAGADGCACDPECAGATQASDERTAVRGRGAPQRAQTRTRELEPIELKGVNGRKGTNGKDRYGSF